MKRLVVGLALVAVFATASYAGTAREGQVNLTLGGGINAPSSEGFDSGYVLGGSIGYHVSSQLVLGGEVAYLGYTVETGTLDMRGNDVDYSMRQHFVEYMATAKYYASSRKTTPYLKGFVGRFDYGFTSTIDGQTLEFAYEDLQFGGGVGLLFRGEAESNLCFEALVHSLRGEEESERIFTLTMGMDFGFSP